MGNASSRLTHEVLRQSFPSKTFQSPSKLSLSRASKWLPNTDSSVLASTANELRRDKYTPVNPKKLKAAAVGLSQNSMKKEKGVATLMVGLAASKLELHNISK
ncbi:unnamed protein product [Camellia sinensis]